MKILETMFIFCIAYFLIAYKQLINTFSAEFVYANHTTILDFAVRMKKMLRVFTMLYVH